MKITFALILEFIIIVFALLPICIAGMFGYTISVSIKKEPEITEETTEE